MRVMIVEDEKIIRMSLKKIINTFSDHSLQVIAEAHDGQSALMMTRETMPELLITDIRMPIMNGLELVEKLQQNGFRGEVIILSGYDDFKFAKQAMKLGVREYLLKPIDPKELKQSLERLQSRREKTQTDQVSWLKFNRLLREVAESLVSGLIHGKEWQRQEEWTDLVLRLESIQLGSIRSKEKYLLFYEILKEELNKYELTRVQLDHFPELASGQQISTEEIIALLQSLYEQLRMKRNWGAELIVERAMQMITQNYERPDLKLQDLAIALDLTPSHLSRLFKSVRGETLIRYLTKYRLQQACELMSHPTKKLQEIAESVGYSEYAHFSRVFKTVYGMTPREYRRIADAR